MNESAKIFIADHQGMIGAAVERALKQQGHPAGNILTCSAAELSLHDQAAVQAFIRTQSPDQIYLPVPGLSGTQPEPAATTTLLGLLHVIHAAHAHGVKKLLLIGTPHIYPRSALSPLAEDDLLSGRLDPATERFALAQIAAIKACDAISRPPAGNGTPQGALDYRCIVTPTPYGPGDRYGAPDSSTIASLIHRLHQAKAAGERHVHLPLNGAVWREYQHVDDSARAAIYLMNVGAAAYQQQTQRGVAHINAGDSHSCSTKALAQTIADVVGYSGVIDMPMPQTDSEPHVRLDSHRMHSLGWSPFLAIEDGLALTYFDYLAHHQLAVVTHPLQQGIANAGTVH